MTALAGPGQEVGLRPARPSYHVLNEETSGRRARNTGSTRGAARTRLSSRPSAISRPSPSHPELATVPWALWGHSAGAGWSDVMSTASSRARRGGLLPFRRSARVERQTRHVSTGRQSPSQVYAIPRMCSAGVKEKGLTQDSCWPPTANTAPMARRPASRRPAHRPRVRRQPLSRHSVPGRLPGNAVAGQGSKDPDA